MIDAPLAFGGTQAASLWLSLGFAVLLVLGTLLRLWLAARQIRHVAAHRNAVPGAFEGTVSLAAHQKAADYTVAKTRLGLIDIALSVAVLLGWTLMGGLDALNGWLLSFLAPGLWQQVALVVAFALVSGVIELPMSLYQTFVLEQRFGFNRGSLGLWLADLARSTLLALLFGVPLVTLALWLMGAAGSGWWLWVWALWTGFNLLMLVIYPSFIAPLFNQFKPLADTALSERVGRLMARCGFQAQGLFVMDGSRRSGHANAYFTGLGRAKRVVFFDTLLARLSPAEVEAVLAHELGHFRHKHVLKRMVGIFAMSLAALAALGWLARQPWFYLGLGVTPNLTLQTTPGLGAPNDALALILFMLAAPVVAFFVSPLMALLSRRDEFQADAYAAAQADPRDLTAALLKLYEDNAATLTPDPLYVDFYYSHPPAAQRIQALGRLAVPGA